MSNIQLQIYDFTLPAGGAMPLPVAGSYFRILTCTGDVDVIGDTFGRLGPINRGQGLADKAYGRLTIRDRSGAPNVGTILVSDANFIDQTLFGSISLAGAVALDAATLAALEQINVRPEAYTAGMVGTAAVGGNTAEVVFTAAANVNGAIVLYASVSDYGAANTIALLAKNGAPTSVADGAPVAMGRWSFTAANNQFSLELQQAAFVPAGVGLYFISNGGFTAASANYRACRYKLL